MTTKYYIMLYEIIPNYISLDLEQVAIKKYDALIKKTWWHIRQIMILYFFKIKIYYVEK